MILIEDKIISDDVVERQFVCNLEACKGACCWQGDYGAPLTDEEREILKKIYEDVKPFLLPEGIEAIENQGLYTYVDKAKEYGTTLIANGACAYMTRDENGVAQCGIEQANKAGATNFLKPISCHLYPIRVEHNGIFEAINYDKWEICSAACELGKKLEMPVYQFVKAALIRKYGEDFYEALEGAAAVHETPS